MEQLHLPVGPPCELDQLAERLETRWPNLEKARQSARDALERLNRELGGLVRDSNSSVVVYGSLARLEFTQGSDLDWTLLVDGAADPAHRETEIAIRERVAGLGFDPPAPGGAFGGLTFSHDLVHKIGGEDDTNRNTTQRILLLLESMPVGDSTRYDNVVRNVLRRYIEEDHLAPDESPFRVPRFLHNDVSRYWRTMAVDFAQKRRASAGKRWALRTVKLQMSRKLMYAAGLLACFSCQRGAPGDPAPPRGRVAVVSHLEALVRKTALDIVAGAVLSSFGDLSVHARGLFSAYDEFLGVLDDPVRRDHLEGLAPGAENDSGYREAREIGKRFGEALTAMFFDSRALAGFTRRYGVF